MKKIHSRVLAFLLAITFIIASAPLTSFAAEVYNNITISSNTTWYSDTDIYGKCVVNWGKTLTIPSGVTVIIHDGASLEGWGTVNIWGKLVIESGGHFYRSEYGTYQQIVGPYSDVGTWNTPVLAINNGSITINNNCFTIDRSSTVKVARSSARLPFEYWILAPEAELMYMDGIETNVYITGLDYTQNPTTDYSRLILGMNAKNNSIGLDSWSTYYWIYNSQNGGGKWVKFDGLAVMLNMESTSTDGMSADQLTWYNAFMAAQKANDPALTDDEAYIYTNQIYDQTRDTRNTYNLFIPKNAPKDRPISLVLFTHGGSWVSGTKESMDYACAKLTRQGYITADIDYRLFSAPTNAATSMDDIMNDMTNCINTIVAQAAAQGYTIDSVATSGYSAGGHLALLYAYSRTNSASVPIKLVFELVGPADLDPSAFAPGFMQFQTAFDTFAGKLIPNYSSLSTEERNQALDNISPLNYINSDTVPTIMVYASRDIIVGNVHGARMNTALSNANIDYTYLTLTRSNHTCEFDSDVVDQFWSTTYNYCNTYLNK